MQTTPCLVTLSDRATDDDLRVALEFVANLGVAEGGGELLGIVPERVAPGLPPATEMAAVVADVGVPHLFAQLRDAALFGMRPKLVVGDLASIDAIVPLLDRCPQLSSAVVIVNGSPDGIDRQRIMAAFANYREIT